MLWLCISVEENTELRQQLESMDTMRQNVHVWWEQYRAAMAQRQDEKGKTEWRISYDVDKDWVMGVLNFCVEWEEWLFVLGRFAIVV